jgi:hypothetical protein
MDDELMEMRESESREMLDRFENYNRRGGASVMSKFAMII